MPLHTQTTVVVRNRHDVALEGRAEDDHDVAAFRAGNVGEIDCVLGRRERHPALGRGERNVRGAGGRIAQAAQLKKAGYASWVILTQAGDTSPDMDARKLDVPGEMLLIAPGQVTSTYEEALTVRQLMSQRGLKTCIVVTDPYHTQRARLIFREVLGQAGINVWVYPVQDHWYRSTTWWRSWDGIQVTFQEYLKLLVYLAGSRLE